MKPYSAPDLEIIRFDVPDILTFSGWNVDGEHGGSVCDADDDLPGWGEND